MVPQFRPQAALHMLDKLVHYEDLAPLLPSNATLVAMSTKEFSSALDKWTESAMAGPYVTSGVNQGKQTPDAETPTAVA